MASPETNLVSWWSVFIGSNTDGVRREFIIVILRPSQVVQDQALGYIRNAAVKCVFIFPI